MDEKHRNIFKEALDWLKYIVAALVFAFLLNSFVIISAQVVSPSMESTIMTNSRIIGLRLAYVWGAPRRFDIIVFKFPDDETVKPYVKRIVGLPGEKVEIVGGKVYIDDNLVPLDDSFINEPPRASEGPYGPYIVPEGCYFVMGDNRNNSNDSKNWNNKFVAKEKIMGKVLFSWYPKVQFFFAPK